MADQNLTSPPVRPLMSEGELAGKAAQNLDELDEELAESFPASDPPSLTRDSRSDQSGADLP